MIESQGDKSISLDDYGVTVKPTLSKILRWDYTGTPTDVKNTIKTLKFID